MNRETHKLPKGTDLYATQTYGRHQQNRVKKYQKNNDSYSFFNLLTSDDLFNKVEELLPGHRERLYTPTETLSMFLAQAMSDDRSCQNIVSQAALQRLSGGLKNTGSSHTGGYCRAQQRGQQPGLGFPICRVVGITCYFSGALLDAAIGRFNGKGGDEQTLLRSLQSTFQAGDIVLGDAFFATCFLSLQCNPRVSIS